MKKSILLCLFILPGSIFFAQLHENPKPGAEDYGLYVSGGVHLDFWWVMMNLATQNMSSSDQKFTSDYIPFNVNIDKLCKNRFAFGAGYTYNKYPVNPLTVETSNIIAIRQNIRFRFYKYLADPEKTFSPFMGGGFGLSHWKPADSKYPDVKITQEWWPSAQFIFGFKVKINDAIFWQSEFCIGPPYAIQTSLGVKF